MTGSATGIGRAAAVRVAHEGARVATFDINDKQAEKTLLTIKQTGGTARYWHVDVSNEQEITYSVDQAIDWLGGGVDILLHVAGVLKGADLDITEFQEETWDLVLILT